MTQELLDKESKNNGRSWRVLRQYRRVLPFLRPHLLRFLPLFGLSIISTALTLAQPYLTKLLIDDALQHRSFRSLQLFAFWMVAAAVLSFAVGILSNYLYTKLSALVFLIYGLRFSASCRICLRNFMYRSKRVISFRA